MAENTKILTAEQESQLRAPIDEYVGAIQEKINALRADGTDKVIDLHNSIDGLKRDKIYTQEEKTAKLAQYQKELEQAKAVEAQNKDEIAKLIADAEGYLKEQGTEPLEDTPCLRLTLETTGQSGAAVLCSVWLDESSLIPRYAEFSQNGNVVLTVRMISFACTTGDTEA